MKLRDLLEYVYADLWEYILIVKGYFWLLSEYWVQSYICLWRLFILHLLIFLSLHDILTSMTCPIVVSAYWSTCLVCVWWLWAFPKKKLKKSKTSKVLFKEWLISSDEISDACSSCFKVTLTSLVRYNKIAGESWVQSRLFCIFDHCYFISSPNKLKICHTIKQLYIQNIIRKHENNALQKNFYNPFKKGSFSAKCAPCPGHTRHEHGVHLTGQGKVGLDGCIA